MIHACTFTGRRPYTLKPLERSDTLCQGVQLAPDDALLTDDTTCYDSHLPCIAKTNPYAMGSLAISGSHMSAAHLRGLTLPQLSTTRWFDLRALSEITARHFSMYTAVVVRV